MNVFLVGLRGSGKSSVGARVAGALGMAFIDQDEEVCRCAGKSIRRLFDEDGESEFRRCETLVLSDICRKEGQVVATGGGVVLAQQNRDLLKRCGKTLYLHADAGILAPRILGDPRTGEQRPALTECSNLEAEMETLYRQRDALYREVASEIIDASGDIGDVAQAVLDALGKT